MRNFFVILVWVGFSLESVVDVIVFFDNINNVDVLIVFYFEYWGDIKFV